MKKAIFIILSILFFGIGIFYGFSIFYEKPKNTEISDERQIENKLINNNFINENGNTIRTNNYGEKISPNATLIFKKKYKECNHIIRENIDIPNELVNKGREDVAQKYPGWNIIGFSPKEIVLYKEYEGICDEHYVIKQEDGFLTIYKIDQQKNENFYRTTDIAVKYLTDEDKKKLKDRNLCI